jgi:cell division protein FtsB
MSAEAWIALVGLVAVVSAGVWRYHDLARQVSALRTEKDAVVAERDALLAKVASLEDQLRREPPAPPLNYPDLHLA